MNVLLNAGGGPLRSTAGDPTSTATRRGTASLDQPHHNTVVPGLDIKSADRRVSALTESDDARLSVVAGVFDLTDDNRMRRFVVLLKPGILVVVDRLDKFREPARLAAPLAPAARERCQWFG